MISVVIPTLNDAARLTATLATLAPAAMDGFVRQVIVSDGGSTDETLEIADDTGADIVKSGLADAIAAARQPWVLILAAGARPQVGWERAAHAHMRDYPDKAGWFDLALAGRGFGARLREAAAWFDRVLMGRPGSDLLIEIELLKQVGPIDRQQDIGRKLERPRLRRLGVRVLVSSR